MSIQWGELDVTLVLITGFPGVRGSLQPEVQKLAKNRSFTPKRYKNGSETEVGIRVVFAIGF